MALSIRTFKEDDLSQVSDIETSSFKDPWPPLFLTHIHKKFPDLFLVAEEKEKVVGYVIGEIRETMLSGLSHRSKTGHLINIAVLESRRKRGIGNLLLKEMESQFKNKGSTQIILEVRESNNSARVFYENWGFTEVGRVRAYYPDEDAIIMRKAI
jgi:ribosomal-protein-alanine N-acetyltransferase